MPITKTSETASAGPGRERFSHQRTSSTSLAVMPPTGRFRGSSDRARSEGLAAASTTHHSEPTRSGSTSLPTWTKLQIAVGRQTGSRVAPSGAVAANRLGLSTQVPAKPVYLTDGRSRQVRVGNYTLQIKHVPPKELPAGSRTSALIFQALRFLGKDAVTDHVIDTIPSALTPEDRRQLLDDAKYATDWICETVRKIASHRELTANG